MYLSSSKRFMTLGHGEPRPAVCGDLGTLPTVGRGRFKNPEEVLHAVRKLWSNNEPAKVRRKEIRALRSVQPIPLPSKRFTASVVEVTNPKTKKSHKVCPWCFNNPPQQDIEDIGKVWTRCSLLSYAFILIPGSIRVGSAASCALNRVAKSLPKGMTNL
eukprot:1119119-Amorphochlora_amoeboformis.AAC.1